MSTAVHIHNIGDRCLHPPPLLPRQEAHTGCQVDDTRTRGYFLFGGQQQASQGDPCILVWLWSLSFFVRVLGFLGWVSSGTD